ncbi:chorismate-binding protein [Neisseria gonorrhoeae]
MQVVPSQRMSMEFTDNPLALYRALRTLNPSPYLFYYDFGDFHIVVPRPKSSSAANATTSSSAHRRHAPARQTPAEDLANEQDLLSDAKEIAEPLCLSIWGATMSDASAKQAKSKSPTKW